MSKKALDEQLHILQIDCPYDDFVEIIGVYDTENLEKAKEIFVRNGGEYMEDWFVVRSFQLNKLPFDLEKANEVGLES